MHFQTIHYILYPGKFQRVISGSEDHFLPAMIVHPFDQFAPGNKQSPADPQAGEIITILTTNLYVFLHFFSLFILSTGKRKTPTNVDS
jgi:hypothetical protein